MPSYEQLTVAAFAATRFPGMNEHTYISVDRCADY